MLLLSHGVGQTEDSWQTERGKMRQLNNKHVVPWRCRIVYSKLKKRINQKSDY